MAVGLAGRNGKAGNIGARIRFGNGKKAYVFARDPSGDIFFLLFGRAEFVDGDRRSDILEVRREPP